MTQKLKSGLLRFLWQSDPFKAKWTIVAKAYSTIRDRHRDSRQVTLDTFLARIGPYIGLVTPAQYLNVMGWELAVDEIGQKHLIKKAQPGAGPDPALLITNLSVADIVQHCYNIGYVTRGGITPAQNPGAGAAMAFAAQPTPMPYANVTGTPANTVNVNQAITQQHGGIANGSSITPAPAPITNVQTPDELNDFDFELARGLNDFFAEEESTNTPISHDAVMRDQQMALEFSGDVYPFNGQFNPAVEIPVLGFDPERIQEDFDAFDINDHLSFFD